MIRMSKGFCMDKSAGSTTDIKPVCGSLTSVETKRSHEWLVDPDVPENYHNKKQLVQAPESTFSVGPGVSSIRLWDSSSSFLSSSNHQLNSVFGCNVRTPGFADDDVTSLGTDNFANRSKEITGNQFGKESSLFSPESHVKGDAKLGFSYGIEGQVKADQVNGCDGARIEAKEFIIENQSEIDTSMVHVCNKGNRNNFKPVGDPCNEPRDFIALTGNADPRSPRMFFDERDSNSISTDLNYSQGDHISFANFDEPYGPSLVQVSETPILKELDSSSNVSVIANSTVAAPSRMQSVPKMKSETKSLKKEAPNIFPSNVRSLISTGILDGVPIKYITVTREELQGIIKGSGYQCGCGLCNYSKVLNAYEFERHAGFKTKHPNNHIFFENGKTIYGIVQELRNTPQSHLFDVIQTITGSPINQKSFRVWKESFQAATRELQRIYGKEE